jgi:hypothetical protein
MTVKPKASNQQIISVVVPGIYIRYSLSSYETVGYTSMHQVHHRHPYSSSYQSCCPLTVRQEMRTGKMCFAIWGDFTVEFALMCCLGDRTAAVLIYLESERYFQGRKNINAYIDKFKDLINLWVC